MLALPTALPPLAVIKGISRFEGRSSLKMWIFRILVNQARKRGPPTRQGGRRMYGPEELHRLAFIKIAQRLGLPLDTAAAVLDVPGPQWRQTVRQQIAALDEVIAQAQGSQRFLAHALNCPTNHPARDCATMIVTLDRLVDGTTVDQLVAEHT